MKNSDEKDTERISEQLSVDNLKISQAEYEKDYSWLSMTLADDLVFRRANGTVVDKECYLAQLVDPANSYTKNDPDKESMDVTIFDDTAVVTLLIHADGQRRSGPFQGTFRNIRIWQRRDAAWQCVAWFNTKLG